MNATLRIQLELGPKEKRVIAVAPDWPGLSRGAKTREAAIERLRAYIPRYAPVADLAGLGDAFSALNRDEVVEEYPGVGSTDFWGISFAFSSIDQQSLSSSELQRLLALLRGSWAYFDQVRSRVSPEMQRGPRGGGRDRDHIVRHTIVSELDMSKKVKLPVPDPLPFDEPALSEHRAAYIAAIEQYHAEGKMARSWPLRYLIRHTAFHTLDHTWEMEDKDLSAEKM